MNPLYVSGAMRHAVAAFVLFFVLFAPALYSQPMQVVCPPGEAVSHTVNFSNDIAHSDFVFEATNKEICIYRANNLGEPIDPPLSCRYFHHDIYIVDVKPKQPYGTSNLTTNYKEVVITLSDGEVLTYQLYNGTEANEGLVPLLPNEIIKHTIGDDLYALTSSYCYVTRDSGASWLMDTLGLGGGYMHQADLDSNQRVYLGTSLGLFTQELISSTWIKNTNYPNTNVDFVFVDRKMRIWASTGANLYMSANFGATFNAGPTGLGSGILTAWDDVYGNLYVISSSGDKIYKSTGGTASFVEIDAGILSQIHDANLYYIFNSISADTNVTVGSKYGLFTTTDQGLTWNFLGREAQQNYGLAKTAAGRLAVSNNEGVHTEDAGSNTWGKTYPAAGFSKAARIFKDNSGNLYTTSDANALIWKSTNNGDTWSLDTATYSTLSQAPYSFYVDGNGNEHAFSFGGQGLLYVRNIAGSWMLDTAGFATSGGTVNCWGTDMNGYLYAANNLGLQKRLLSGGSWMFDTIGLPVAATVYDLAVDRNGTLWAGTYQMGLYKRVSTTWQQVSNPPGTNSSNSCFVVSADTAGAVWTQWTTFNIHFDAIGTGVFYTLDGGANWVSMNFDTITFRQLVSVGDTTYGVSYYDGIWQFNRNSGPLNIAEVKTESGFNIYPNPATGDFTMNVSDGFVGGKSEISDLSGRKIQKSNIENRISHIELPNLTPGIYFVRVTNANMQQVRKLVVE